MSPSTLLYNAKQMDAGRAAEQIAEIHRHLSRSEVYRGWRAAPVALSGLIGLAAAWLQEPALSVVEGLAVGQSDPAPFVIYWSAVAVVAAAAGMSEIFYNYVVSDEAFGRRQTRRVAAQFLPAIGVAALATATFVGLGAAFVALLPGLWALLFGLAILASRPYLPRASAWVVWYYLICGATLLWNAHTPLALSPWAVGGVFGVGQLLAAAVIYWNLERRHVEEPED